MSTYAVDQERHALMAFWATGAGHEGTTVAKIPDAANNVQAQHLAHALTRFADAAWKTYTHPASAAASLEENSEGWRREADREALGKVSEILTAPNLPEGGMLTQSYIPTEEAAHQVGRVLHAIGDTELTKLIAAEVREELHAIEQAELGDLTGRARQAVLLSRTGASPVQVQAADRLLHQAPLGADALFTDIDPVAGAVAAAHWLQAAADVTAEASGLAPTQIVEEADNIEALPHQTPTLVLELMAEGVTPYAAVTGLIREAMTVAEGRIPNVDELRERIEKAEELADTHNTGDPNLGDALLQDIRITPLDPMRPARDLLEDLLYGIRGCWLLYLEHADLEPDDEDEDEDASTDAFIDAIREEADENHDRLT